MEPVTRTAIGVLLAAISADVGAEAPAAPTPPQTRPQLISGPEPEYPAAERDAGHHGTVMISGLLGTDGRLKDATVLQSSGAPLLDKLALDAATASLFSPARDAAGTPFERRIKIPYTFSRYRSAEPGGGLIRYRCAAFTQDMDWWRSTFPARAWKEHELYLMLRGLTVLASPMDRLDIGRVVKENDAFARRWDKALEACRAKPGARLADVMQPEGKLIDAFSKLSQ